MNPVPGGRGAQGSCPRGGSVSPTLFRAWFRRAGMPPASSEHGHLAVSDSGSARTRAIRAGLPASGRPDRRSPPGVLGHGRRRFSFRRLPFSLPPRSSPRVLRPTGGSDPQFPARRSPGRDRPTRLSCRVRHPRPRGLRRPRHQLSPNGRTSTRNDQAERSCMATCQISSAIAAGRMKKSSLRSGNICRVQARSMTASIIR